MKIVTTLVESDPVCMNLVSHSAVYTALEECDRQIFLEKGYIAYFDIGEYLIKEDEIGDKFFILKSGQVEVFTERSGERITLSILSMGACIGEGSLVTKCRRTANVQCLTDVMAIVFNFDDIEHIIDRNEKAKKLLISLIERRADSTVERILSCLD
ncbi:MAG: cyclic nucleotide-binding domain-containing protein [Deltaproteobacteria bacterium]|nr:cyclic nucleotide-binding domain-containing protein [Deltaproteobacteria bacterium]